MEHSPSEKANSPSDSEEISYTLMEPEYSLPYSQQPTTFSCPETVKPSAQIPNLFPRYIIFPSIPRSSELSFSIRSPNQNPVGASPLPPYALHAQPISFFSILPPEQYWVRVQIIKLLIM